MLCRMESGERLWDDVSLEFLTNWSSFDSYQLQLPALGGYRALAALGLFLALYLGYYLFFVVSKPRVVGGGKEFRNLVLTYCPSLSRRYWPTPWAFYSHMCTVLRLLLQKSPAVTYKRELLALSDGGEVALDWAEPEGGGAGEWSHAPPIMLILTGLSGCSAVTYVKHLACDGLIQGYRPVVFNQRGTAGVTLKTPRTYCAANIDDLREVMARIKSHYPSSPVVGVGVSLGGIILTQYLHQLGRNCDIKAVFTISAPWDLVQTMYSVEGGFIGRTLYSKFLCNKIKVAVKRSTEHLSLSELKKLPYDVAEVAKTDIVSQFDLKLTCRVFGFSTLQEYYAAGSNYGKVHRITRPLLSLHSADDPFTPKHSLPFAECESNPLTVLAVTSHGGHISFVEGLLPTSHTWMNRVCREFLGAMRHYQEPLTRKPLVGSNFLSFERESIICR